MFDRFNYHAKAERHRSEAQGYLDLARNIARNGIWEDEWQWDHHNHFVHQHALHKREARRMERRACRVENAAAALYGIMLWIGMMGTLWLVGFFG